MAENSVHSHCVSEWMKHASAIQPDALAKLFEKAFTALWRRTHSTLGDITGAAIVDRVLHNAKEEHPILGFVKLDSNGVDFTEFRERAGSTSHRELTDAIRFVLVELLTVVGALTAEILTPALHSELSKITPTTDSSRHQSGEKKL
jgi:hypothetical protein